uniref:Pentacotripeptide-repeat region of PRORP domain-containing protein n=1 Tax=Trypanosoma congolense (strain IL3000) TaxID=1068625 RepID=G0USG9_TRYCI|nr:conserved hypothetical protein [Trypanosoma congolense IL3000]
MSHAILRVSIVSGPFVSSNLHEVSVEDLMRTAFALQRCSASKVTSSREGTDTATETHMEGSGVEMQQQQLFKELSRRHRYNELMQCVVNWKSRGLIPTKQSKASLRRLEADGVDGTQPRGSNEQVDGAVTASVPFQATSTDASEGATETVTIFNAEKALQALLFTSTSGSQWEEAMRHHPTFFVQMLRDPTAALQLLRKIGPEALSKLLLSVLINCNAGTAVSASPWMGRVQDGDISWDVVASLCFVLRQHITHRKKVENVDILQALRDALRKGANDTTIIKDGAMKFGPEAAAQRGTASTVATQSFSNHRVRAIRSSVEGLCAALAHHNEPQARFIGLLLFADIALALCNCCVALPNSLVQCIFLCIGDPQCHGQRELGPPSSVDAIQWDRKLVTELISAPPAERWLPALQLLQKCSQQRCFVVTSAHLRCLLSGLQSVSVRRMWAAALSAASSLITQQHIFPDEQSMEKLMLNLHAASWKRAFEVLKLYEKKHVPPSPIILRDLHVVAMKHGTWDMVLRVMHKIEEVGHQQAGFMNYVYCLRAFGCAGKWDKAAKMFAQLKDVPGAIPSRSAFNENTVAVPALAMMENNHWEEVMQFMKSIWMIVGPELTREGAEVSRAAEFLALVHIGDIERVASFLNSYCGYPSNAAAAKARTKGLDSTVLSSGELRAVVVRAAQLQTLLGMEHLNAPVRLVFDLLSTDKSDANVERITSSTRSRSSRQVLYLPPQHVQKQYKWMAVTMGRMVRDGEHLFCPPAQQVVAEAMSAIGAGSVYLEVALM